MQVVVYSDSEEQLRSMASLIGNKVYLDLNGAFSRQLPSRSVPRWVVLNPERKVIASGTGLPRVSGISEEFTHYINKAMGIS